MKIYILFTYICAFILTINLIFTFKLIKFLNLLEFKIKFVIDFYIYYLKYLIILYFTFIVIDIFWWIYWFDKNPIKIIY